VQVVQSALSDEGISSLYKGCDSKVLAGVQQKFQYFYVYALLKQLFGKRYPGVGADLLFGYLAAFQGLGTTLPLEVTNTRIITSKKKKQGQGQQVGKQLGQDQAPMGFMATFMDQLENEGFLSFYRTLSASAILCINPAISYTVFERFKSALLRRRGAPAGDVLTTFEAFWAGVISKLIATIVTFPFIRCKILMSVWKKKTEEQAATCPDPTEAKRLLALPEPGMMATLRSVVELEGVSGLYVGLKPQVIKAVTNAAIMLSMKEKIYAVVRTVVLGKSTTPK
jgi:hypothetical protein